jgi:hypothetical protein
MQNQIDTADFVLMICTETYYRRVHGREAEHVGLGANWEGALITQRLYAAGGKNERFIPVVFTAADTPFVPPFVAGATRYDLSAESGFEALYRHLTKQPLVPRPPIGQLRSLQPRATTGGQSGSRPEHDDRVLLIADGIGNSIVPAEQVRQGATVDFVLRPETSEQRTFLEALAGAGGRRRVNVAFGLTAAIVDVNSVERNREKGVERWNLSCTPTEADYGAGIMEMATSTQSADDIAVLRARRILLDERLSARRSGNTGMLDDSMLNAMIAGISTPLRVDASPLPDVWKMLGHDPAAFVEAARLVAVMWLRLSGVAQFVERLDLHVEGETLFVDFAGVRARKYTNQAPTRIEVRGSCGLGHPK